MTLDDLHNDMLADDMADDTAPWLPLLTHTEALVTLAVLDAVAEHGDDEGLRCAARSLQSRLGQRLPGS
ncbi:hypothetical protein [Streptomyces sp. NPDC097619]|uniref:hypothetical protein n=1 Tax=Streptomyces sp. NPDC097619 TaxID=3157228 RepID=UPI00332DA26D